MTVCGGGALLSSDWVVNKHMGSVLVMMLDMLRQATLSVAVAVAVAAAAYLK